MLQNLLRQNLQGMSSSPAEQFAGKLGHQNKGNWPITLL
ncbi:Uncharacterised protein [Yersinia frederiksenii]|nr:Uncharacterised protein [Yersinia frederiksenii]